MESMENTENIKRMTEYITENLNNMKSIKSVIVDLKITTGCAKATIQKNNQITGNIDGEIYSQYYRFSRYKPEPCLEKILRERNCWQKGSRSYYEEIIERDIKRGRKTHFMDEKEAIKCYGESLRRIVNLDIIRMDSMENAVVALMEFNSLTSEQKENIDTITYLRIKNDVIEQQIQKCEKALPSHHSEQIESVRNPPVQGI